MKKVVVIGASGFLGSTLVETLISGDQFTVVPVIHNSGNAWRLSRLGIPLHSADVMVGDSLSQVVSGSHLVVNCSRGSSEVMRKGLKNLVAVCRRCKVEKLIHISSSAVFGSQFNQTVIDEAHPVQVEPQTYGYKKAKQDQMIRTAARGGLPSTVLCPPNITGPDSAFLQDLLLKMRKGEFALVDDGRLRCSVVDVHNLVEAIVFALRGNALPTDGRRIIIADAQPTCWHELVGPLADLIGIKTIPSISVDEARALARKPDRKKSLLAAAKHLVSSEVRDALRRDPVWDSVHGVAASFAKRLPSRTQQWLSGSADQNGTAHSRKNSSAFDARLITQQLRDVSLSSERANEFGFRPVLDFTQSKRAFARWYRHQFGLDTHFTDLIEQLWT